MSINSNRTPLRSPRLDSVLRTRAATEKVGGTLVQVGNGKAGGTGRAARAHLSTPESSDEIARRRVSRAIRIQRESTSIPLSPDRQSQGGVSEGRWLRRGKLQLAALAATAATLTLGSSALAQERVRIGLANIEYRAPDSAQNKLYGAFGSGVREDTRAFVDMLTTALVKTEKFDVIERDRMEAILEEQGMGQFGLTDGYDKLHLTGLDYVVVGAITEYGMTTQEARFGGFATARTTANMAVDVRVVDVENGMTAIAESVWVEEDGSSGISLDSVAMRGAENEAHLLGSVMRRAARDITFLIVSNVYPIRVATRVATGEIILNYGDGLLRNGETLDVFSEGESVIDPTSGEVLGSEEELVARIEVTDATDRFSKARVIQEYSPVEAGMIARIVTRNPDAQKSGKRDRRKLRR